MLKRLHIQNYLLVEEIDLAFESGFTAMTGETGAGKSMILGALEALFGGSLNEGSVRAGAEKCAIEAEFCVRDAAAAASLLGDEYAADGDGLLILRREYQRGSRARFFAQDRPAPKDLFESLRETLMDFHGQRDNLSLYRPARQLEFLDAFAGTQAELLATQEAHGKRAALLREFAELEATLMTRRKEQALLQYQLDEIERLGLADGEEQRIHERLRTLEHSEKLNELAARLNGLLNQDDACAVTLSGQARNTAQEIAKIDGGFQAVADELGELAARLKDAALDAARYAETIELDPRELDELRRRAATLAELKRKHGVDVAQILEQARGMKAALAELEEGERKAAKLSRDIETASEELRQAARKLSKKRAQAKTKFCEGVTASLGPLGFHKPRFEIELTSADLDAADAIGRSGADRAQFMFSAAAGQKLEALAAVASGGESSRVTLAIKSIVAEKMRYPLLVYDELDLGISGKTADAVGQVLSRLARKQQVIVITHLPQIAARADRHLEVSKETVKGRTVTRARMLSERERTAAVATLLSGAEVSGSAMAAAGDLLAKRKPRTKQAGTVG